MILFKSADTLHEYLNSLAVKGIVTGFVPTMGALHDGHLRLVAQGREKAGIMVCSIFVNPTQFNDPSDFSKYPVTIENDIRLLEAAGCDILFLPDVAEMYPNGTEGRDRFSAGFLDTVLEGSKRPGHFAGVMQVMHRLLEIVHPDFLFMGQKDYQQCLVVQQLIDTFNFNTQLIIAPIVREESGLAMSSRNTRLSPGARQKAAIIYQTLQNTAKSLEPGNVTPLTKRAEQQLLDHGFEKVDYVSLANATTLEPITTWDGTTPVVILVAAFIDGVRLIDNLIV